MEFKKLNTPVDHTTEHLRKMVENAVCAEVVEIRHPTFIEDMIVLASSINRWNLKK